MEVIYPQIKTDEYVFTHEIKLTFETWLRKKHTDGLWYLVLFFQHYLFDKTSVDNLCIITVLNKFHAEVYKFQISGIVIPGQKTHDGTPCVVLYENKEGLIKI